jgi:hypothetical protein
METGTGHSDRSDPKAGAATGKSGSNDLKDGMHRSRADLRTTATAFYVIALDFWRSFPSIDSAPSSPVGGRVD